MVLDDSQRPSPQFFNIHHRSGNNDQEPTDKSWIDEVWWWMRGRIPSAWTKYSRPQESYRQVAEL